MELPSQDRINAGVQAMKRMHATFGYRRAPRDLEQMLWAALFALWDDWQCPNKSDEE